MQFQHKNFPSEYELKNVIWVGLEYNKKKLIKFFKKYNYYKSLPQNEEPDEMIRIMDEIVLSHGNDKLNKLLNNDKDYSRWATIESISKVASIEFMLHGKYSEKTFSKMSHLPIVDFKLVIKRIQELVNNVDKVIKDTDLGNTNIPGVK
jgi:hypothetical protein